MSTALLWPCCPLRALSAGCVPLREASSGKGATTSASPSQGQQAMHCSALMALLASSAASASMATSAHVSEAHHHGSLESTSLRQGALLGARDLPRADLQRGAGRQRAMLSMQGRNTPACELVRVASSKHLHSLPATWRTPAPCRTALACSQAACPSLLLSSTPCTVARCSLAVAQQPLSARGSAAIFPFGERLCE